MKKLLFILSVIFAIGIGTNESFAQKIKLSKESQEVIAKSSKWTLEVNGFVLIWYDTEGRMDLHETMSKIEKDYNPDLTIVKDDELGVWRLAVTLEENGRMEDKMSTVRGKYTNAIPYKRTGYIDN